jgi:hypothetical protein
MQSPATDTVQHVDGIFGTDLRMGWRASFTVLGTQGSGVVWSDSSWGRWSKWRLARGVGWLGPGVGGEPGEAGRESIMPPGT